MIRSKSLRNGSDPVLEDDLTVALPEPGLSLTQDAEWCVVEVDGEWRQIRFHDYDTIYSIPGLYEKVIYEILQCCSPATVRRMIEAALPKAGLRAEELRVLDLGAGNDMMAEELADLGARKMAGIDITETAASAAERDRPGLYEDYHVVDMTDLSEPQERTLRAGRFNCLTCVAALGFGDIPAEAFSAAFNLIQPEGMIAFNIKENFLTGDDDSGFARLIRSMIRDGVMEVWKQQRYRHRMGTDREPIHYVAICGRKVRDVRRSGG
jgi:SAM-dependent methyltransferase